MQDDKKIFVDEEDVFYFEEEEEDLLDWDIVQDTFDEDEDEDEQEEDPMEDIEDDVEDTNEVIEDAFIFEDQEQDVNIIGSLPIENFVDWSPTLHRISPPLYRRIIYTIVVDRKFIQDLDGSWTTLSLVREEIYDDKAYGALKFGDDGLPIENYPPSFFTLVVVNNIEKKDDDNKNVFLPLLYKSNVNVKSKTVYYFPYEIDPFKFGEYDYVDYIEDDSIFYIDDDLWLEDHFPESALVPKEDQDEPEDLMEYLAYDKVIGWWGFKTSDYRLNGGVDYSRWYPDPENCMYNPVYFGIERQLELQFFFNTKFGSNLSNFSFEGKIAELCRKSKFMTVYKFRSDDGGYYSFVWNPEQSNVVYTSLCTHLFEVFFLVSSISEFESLRSNFLRIRDSEPDVFVLNSSTSSRFEFFFKIYRKLDWVLYFKRDLQMRFWSMDFTLLQRLNAYVWRRGHMGGFNTDEQSWRLDVFYDWFFGSSIIEPKTLSKEETPLDPVSKVRGGSKKSLRNSGSGKKIAYSVRSSSKSTAYSSGLRLKFYLYWRWVRFCRYVRPIPHYLFYIPISCLFQIIFSAVFNFFTALFFIIFQYYFRFLPLFVRGPLMLIKSIFYFQKFFTRFLELILFLRGLISFCYWFARTLVMVTLFFFPILAAIILFFIVTIISILVLFFIFFYLYFFSKRRWGQRGFSQWWGYENEHWGPIIDWKKEIFQLENKQLHPNPPEIEKEEHDIFDFFAPWEVLYGNQGEEHPRRNDDDMSDVWYKSEWFDRGHIPLEHKNREREWMDEEEPYVRRDFLLFVAYIRFSNFMYRFYWFCKIFYYHRIFYPFFNSKYPSLIRHYILLEFYFSFYKMVWLGLAYVYPIFRYLFFSFLVVLRGLIKVFSKVVVFPLYWIFILIPYNIFHFIYYGFYFVLKKFIYRPRLLLKLHLKRKIYKNLDKKTNRVFYKFYKKARSSFFFLFFFYYLPRFSAYIAMVCSLFVINSWLVVNYYPEYWFWSGSRVIIGIIIPASFIPPLYFFKYWRAIVPPDEEDEGWAGYFVNLVIAAYVMVVFIRYDNPDYFTPLMPLWPSILPALTHSFYNFINFIFLWFGLGFNLFFYSFIPWLYSYFISIPFFPEFYNAVYKFVLVIVLFIKSIFE